MYSADDLLKVMVETNASDLFISVGAFPMLKIDGKSFPVEKEKITPKILTVLLKEFLKDDQVSRYNENGEIDYNYSVPEVGRFRINCFRQRNSDSIVVRRISTSVKSIQDLNLPGILGELVEAENGLILVVGSTGSGKSTTLAAMIDHRNENQSGHILTLEDPIEFLHSHKKSVVNQREIGHDTESYQSGLKSALRETPSVLLVGEIRDKATLQEALNFSGTGHLVLSTLHATNASRAVEHIFSFFDIEEVTSIQYRLSSCIRAIIVQRLVPAIDGHVTAALEIMLASPRIKDLIAKGNVDLISNTIEASTAQGMNVFDQAFYKMVVDGFISQETALKYADHPTNLRLKLKSRGDQKTQQVIELIDEEK